jgi:serine/threonine protein kinase
VSASLRNRGKVVVDLMSTSNLLTFVDLLHDCRLVSPDQLDELRRHLLPHYRDERTLAKHLVQRGWLTVYQVNQLLQGHAQELVLGPCRILDRLGEGAISQVYKAWHTVRQCLVALKVLRPDFLDNESAVHQFEREIHAVTRLSHPNIVTAVEVGQVGTRRFLAMEYMEGTDLGKFVQLSGPLPVGHACDYVRQAALGLQHAHENGLVHRDIKPANLFLSTPGEGGGLRLSDRAVVKILDWGLSHMHLPRHQLKNTTAWIQPGALVGTADFMAPEQARDPRSVDIRADIYSLGCTLYFLLTGQVPFPGKSLMQKLLQHETAEPPAVEALRPDLPRTLPLVLRKMLAKRPEDRHPIPLAVAVVLAPFCRVSRSGAMPPRPLSAPTLAGK